jgi:hypothetical protein
MIKRFRFVTRRAGLSDHDFAAAFVAAVTLIGHGPSTVRPLRAVACTTMRGIHGTEAPCDGISIEWFADLEALKRFEAWLDSEDRRRGASVANVIEPSVSSQFIAEEQVMRGADWLARRWASGAVKVKHMALARRAAGLSVEAFSERWRNKAGTVTAAAAPIVIPEAAKGLAYVQNHPLPRDATEGRYDAVNEVYFDDLEAMRARLDFFRQNDVGRAEAALVSEATFVAVAERVV